MIIFFGYLFEFIFILMHRGLLLDYELKNTVLKVLVFKRHYSIIISSIVNITAESLLFLSKPKGFS